MSLDEYFSEIESFEFGAQFSVFSGFRLVLSDMDENETLQKLVRTLRSDPEKSRVLSERLRNLLDNPPLEGQLAFDGSLASYLYCLWKVDLQIGFSASQEVLQTPDLWWSAKLALLVRKEYIAEQILKSVHYASLTGDPVPIALTGREYASLPRLGQYSYYAGALEELPDVAPSYEYQRSSSDRANIEGVSLTSSSGQFHYKDKVTPTEEFEMSIAS